MDQEAKPGGQELPPQPVGDETSDSAQQLQEGISGHRSMLTDEVAGYLEFLANRIRIGQLTAVSFEWEGGTVINAKIKPLVPLEFIKIDLTVWKGTVMSDLPEEYVVAHWLCELANKINNQEVTGLALKWEAGTKRIEYQIFDTAIPQMPVPTEMPKDKSLN
jgi:hypothetical protein